MIEGPNQVCVCVPCLHASKKILLAVNRTARCSFCGKIVPDTANLVKGIGEVRLCADCLELGLKIASDGRASFKGSPSH